MTLPQLARGAGSGRCGGTGWRLWEVEGSERMCWPVDSGSDGDAAGSGSGSAWYRWVDDSPVTGLVCVTLKVTEEPFERLPCDDVT